jgi:hypothetical protein
MSWRKRIVLALASGASLWPLAYFLDWLDAVIPVSEKVVSYVLVGGIFGALVLVPFVAGSSLRLGRTMGLVIGSILIYSLVAELAVEKYGPLQLDYDTAVVMSGLLGACLAGLLTILAAPLRISSLFWLYVPFAGLVGGFLFSLLWETNNNAVIAAAYAAWQVPVCLALHGGSARS